MPPTDWIIRLDATAITCISNTMGVVVDDVDVDVDVVDNKSITLLEVFTRKVEGLGLGVGAEERRT